MRRRIGGDQARPGARGSSTVGVPDHPSVIGCGAPRSLRGGCRARRIRSAVVPGMARRPNDDRVFRAAGTGSTRVASLRYGSTPGLQFGRNTLYVRTWDGKGRRWFTQRSFVLARPVGGLFNAATATPGCGTGADVRVDLVRPGLAVTVRVDGGRPRAIRGGRERSINLYANSGLHPGANVLTVQALDAGRGVYQRRVLRVTMPSAIPVAAAGISRRAKTGHVTQFSAAASVKTGPGQRLVYRWTIVTRPRGSRPGCRVLTARTRSCGPIGRGATSCA